MKYGHRIQGRVTSIDDRGRGTFELDANASKTYDQGSGTVAIPFTAVGDEIVATFVKRDRGVKIARVESLTTPSENRVTPTCPHAGICGGCLWQHLAYDAQLQLKRDMINRAFEHAGHSERVDAVEACTGSDTSHGAPLFYRNRMDYAVGWLNQIGLKEYDSWNRYLDLTTCFLLSHDVAEILTIARKLRDEFEWEPWDAKFHTGVFRYVVIREGKNTHERLIMFVVADETKITEAARAAMKERLAPLCTTLLIGEQPLITDLSYVKRAIPLIGNPWIEEVVNDTRYRIAPNSFFQTNSGMAARLQETVHDFLFCHPEESTTKDLSKNTLLDLYCGLGFFGIHFAKRHPDLTVHGHEIDAEAIELATHNAKTNNVDTRCTFTSGPSEDLSWKDLPADAILLDPPRAGLHPRVIKTLLEKRPEHLIYVSCNYHRLVEELKELKTAYTIERLHALDLFPHTPHVEVVVKLKRTDPSV